MVKSIRICSWLLTLPGISRSPRFIRFSRYGRRKLARINRLSSAERQATLVREAKKEGSVVW
jgi:hypothetical protein